MAPKVTPPVIRFWRKVEKTDSCWLWRGAVDKEGYGSFALTTSKTVRAHRFAYESTVGPIPAGFVIDHVRANGCTSRSCVNPGHLEAVTQRVNLLRADTFQARNAAKTHCPQGHPYDEGNTGQSRASRGCARRCLTCHRERERLRRARLREREK